MFRTPYAFWCILWVICRIFSDRRSGVDIEQINPLCVKCILSVIYHCFFRKGIRGITLIPFRIFHAFWCILSVTYYRFYLKRYSVWMFKNPTPLLASLLPSFHSCEKKTWQKYSLWRCENPEPLLTSPLHTFHCCQEKYDKKTTFAISKIYCNGQDLDNCLKSVFWNSILAVLAYKRWLFLTGDSILVKPEKIHNHENTPGRPDGSLKRGNVRENPDVL